MSDEENLHNPNHNNWDAGGYCNVMVMRNEGGETCGFKKGPEAVNHPDHYGGDTVYEVIKVLEAWELGFHLGNTVKYIARAGKKDKAKEIEDLKKAQFYLKRKIEQLESNGKGK